MNNINEVNQTRIKFLKKEIIDDFKENKTYLNKNLKKIEKIIEDRYEKPSSRSSYFSSLAMLAQALGGDDDRAYLRFSKLATDYATAHANSRKTGELSANEKNNIHSFENYSIRREICYDKWIDDKTNTQKNLRALFMAMATLYPPLRRGDYLNLKIIDKLPKTKTDDNFLLINKHQCTLVFNKPSKSKEHEVAFRAGEYPLNTILSARILESIHYFPRDYLFSSIKEPTESMTDGSFYKLLDGIYPNEVVRLDYLRKSYEYFIGDQKFSKNTAFREKISRLMFHELSTVNQFYSKIEIEKEPENDKYQITIAFVDSENNVTTKDDAKKYHEYKYSIVLVDGVREDSECESHSEEIIEPEPPKQSNVHFERTSRQPLPKPVHKPFEIIDNDSSDDESVVKKSEPKRFHRQIVENDSSLTAKEKQRLAIQKFYNNPDNKSKHAAIDYCAKLNKGIITNPSAKTLEKHSIVKDSDGKWIINK